MHFENGAIESLCSPLLRASEQAIVINCTQGKLVIYKLEIVSLSKLLKGNWSIPEREILLVTYLPVLLLNTGNQFKPLLCCHLHLVA